MADTVTLYPTRDVAASSIVAVFAMPLVKGEVTTPRVAVEFAATADPVYIYCATDQEAHAEAERIVATLPMLQIHPGAYIRTSVIDDAGCTTGRPPLVFVRYSSTRSFCFAHPNAAAESDRIMGV